LLCRLCGLRNSCCVLIPAATQYSSPGIAW
jgi:hypothetical protein